MTLNSDMKVGALEETVTVSGSSPVVDVQTTTKSQVLSRDVLDAVPTGRTIQGMGQLITGVSLNAPDVGGSRAMQQTYMSAHGSGASQTTVQVDGLMVNGLDVDGAVQNYFNSSMSQEMVYTTSGASADVSGGGVRLNMIPRDGGNRTSGSIFSGYQTKGFQTDNLTQALKDRGLRSTDGIDQLYNVEAAIGGPIKKDKVWYFASVAHLPPRHAAGRRVLASGPATATAAPPRGTEPGVDPQSINSVQARVTWQISPKNKFVDLQRPSRQGPRRRDDRRLRSGDGVDCLDLADLHDRVGEDHLDADATSCSSKAACRSTTSATTTCTSPASRQVPGSPEWYSGHQQGRTPRSSRSGTPARRRPACIPDRFAAAGSVSYITGAHNIKVGMQDTWGRYQQFRSANGDLRANLPERPCRSRPSS